jgi:hypothetical protein
MCFLLYAGTIKPIPRKDLVKEAPDISIRSLAKSEEPIRTHFSTPEVQYVGSTSGCGCDFPNVIHQNGGWPIYEDDEMDSDQTASDQLNREALVRLLQSTGEDVIELYGIWAGNYAKEPSIREEISIESILMPEFFFKEQGFYRVRLQEAAQ